MSTETTAPFNSRGMSWAAVIKLLAWVSPFLIGAAMLYLGREFATHGELRAALQPYEPLPAQVQSLVEFRARQDRAQEKSDGKIEVVQQSLATLAAQQQATDKKVDRVLDALERLNRRGNTP